MWMFMTKKAQKHAHEEELQADTAETSHRQPTWVQTQSLPLRSHNTRRDREGDKQEEKTGVEILSELNEAQTKLDWNYIGHLKMENCSLFSAASKSMEICEEAQ